MRYIGIIPARYASTRFPGKPLALLGGKPMIEHVYRQARKALDEVYVATDDRRIYDCVVGFGGKAIMTSETCRCGTERVWEAYVKLKWGTPHGGENKSEDDVIINIQGDEPFVQPEQIRALMDCFPTEIATLVIPFKAEDGLAALENPNSPKVVVSNGRAILFSRSVIPYLRGVERSQWLEKHTYYKHLGMYAYRADVLEKIVRLEPSPLEQAESLEQLRWLEAGYEIQVGVSETQTIGIDTPEDLESAEAALHALRATTN